MNSEGEISLPLGLLRPLVCPCWAQRGRLRDCKLLVVEAKLQSLLISHTETAFVCCVTAEDRKIGPFLSI
jgi:hypothetical protein